MIRSEELARTGSGSLPSITTLVYRVYERVRTLVKDCNIEPLEPLRKEPQAQQVLLTLCITALEDLRRQVILSRNMLDDYRKLEEVSQRHEAELRKHIGIQQQLKLYAEALQQKSVQEKDERDNTIQQLRASCEQLTEENNRLKEELKRRYRAVESSRERQPRADTAREVNLSFLLPRPEQLLERHRVKSNNSGQSKSPYAVRPKIMKMNTSIGNNQQGVPNAHSSSDQFGSFRPGDSANIPYLVNSLKNKKKKLQHSAVRGKKARQLTGNYTEREVRPFDMLERSKNASQEQLEGNAHIRIKTEAQINITSNFKQHYEKAQGVLPPDGAEASRSRQATHPD